jgi:phosphoribosylaminoimidazolecarboxamide formyltransferase/IMP cyclohydrolase
VSAYGGVIAINRAVDIATAQRLAEQFIEVLLAPSYTDDAFALLSEKKNVRILELPQWPPQADELDTKTVLGGQLVQTRDRVQETREQMQVISARAPDEREWEDMLFAWRVCRYVRSNAIVLVRDGATVGIGAGQMSRVDAVRLAVEKARDAQPDLLAGAVMASDAFFPFPDGVEVGLEAGITAVIQPGGSVRDELVSAAVDAAGAAMVATGVRHFRH